MIGLTKMQRDTLLIIQELTALYGYAPSFQEIANELGVRAKSDVKRLVDGLAERGAISFRPRFPRSITVLRPIPMPEEFEFELTPAALAVVAEGVRL